MRYFLTTLSVVLCLIMGSTAQAQVPEVGHEYIFTERLACVTGGVMQFALAGAVREKAFRTRVALAKNIGLCFQEEPLTKGLVVTRILICIVEFSTFSASAWVLEVRFSENYTVALLWLEPLEEV